MKRLLLLFAAILMASTGMWAETVDYLYPVYNTDGVPTSGIKEWKTASVDATVVENASEQVTWTAGWYVVKGSDVTLSQGAICAGNVNLILADGAKLTAAATGASNYPGIQVSDTDNSLTIYGQTAQTGQLIATGGDAGGAGIGGRRSGSGSNITINGGTITATTAGWAAGIGGGYEGSGSKIIINGGTVTAIGGEYSAGIGGSAKCSGSSITINGGTVTANGGTSAAGIGGGKDGSGSNIIVATNLILKADGNNPPQATIDNTGTDLASSLAGKQYATVEKTNLTTGNFVVSNNIAIYNGEAIAATVALNVEGAGLMTVTYKQNGKAVSPVNAGVYDIYASVAEGNNYRAFEAAKVGTLTINKASLTADNFIFSAPDNLAYDGNAKTTTVVFDGRGGKLTGCGSITIKYNGSTQAPSAIGEYAVSIDIAEGMNFSAVDGMTSDNWKFSINAALVSTTYIDKDGVSHDIDAYEITNSATTVTWGVAGTTTWYVVKGTDVQLSQGAICKGAVNLILADGAKLTATGITIFYYDVHTPSIEVSGEGNSLTIYGQTEQTGQLMANGGENAAGIGGRKERHGSNITINGGIVTANGGGNAAGIGGGMMANGSNITINGGMVTANGGNSGIGGGIHGKGSNIAINGGTVTANGGSSGIGGSEGSGSSDIYVAIGLEVRADRNNPPVTKIATTRSSTTDIATELDCKQHVAIVSPPISTSYIDEQGVSQTIDAYEVTSTNASINWGWPGQTTWYVVKGTDVQLSAGSVCNGTVNLILADGAKLTATGSSQYAGIQVSGEGNSLTVYVQATQSGQLIANGKDHAAGIGGGNGGNGSNITINGGVITANGDGGAAGIGGGNGGNGSNITINGGKVTANCCETGAGIGGGYNASGSNITINGGEVTATGGLGAAGIGGGGNASGSNITINGGTVKATGGISGTGIGGSNITIYGGTVTANGGNSGIGGDNITIYGGTVTANSEGESDGGIGGSNVKVATNLIVKAGFNENAIEIIATIRTSTTDIANFFKGRHLVIIEQNPLPDTKTVTIAAINAAISETDPDDVKAIATNAVTAINAATKMEEVNAIKAFALSAIASAKTAYQSGKAEGLGSLGTEQDGPAVEVIDQDDKSVILYNPKKVNFIKVTSNE